MSYADIVPGTETERLLAEMEKLGQRQDSVAEAVNKMGANVEWIIKNVEGIFQMFGSPQMMSMLPTLMGGAMSAFPGQESTDE